MVNEYRIVREDGTYGAEQLEERVNLLLTEGWEPLGGVAVVAAGGSVTFLQAMQRLPPAAGEGGG